ncbi:MAG: hypothetical protein K2X56_23240 [Mycobacterium pseudokansasii]|nr:hypothetical protein [Mycobacterium pseudokansasii]
MAAPARSGAGWPAAPGDAGLADDAVSARMIVRRVKDANQAGGFFPVLRYHPFFADSTEPRVNADIAHRRRAVAETVFAELIDGPLARIPSGRIGANCAWVLCAAIAHNLLRAAGVLAGARHGTARGAIRRRHLVDIPARRAGPQRRPPLRLRSHWRREPVWLALWHNIISHTSTSD